MDTLQDLLQKSLSFDTQEKQRLLEFFQKNPEKIEQGILVLKEEYRLWEENQKKYLQEVTHVAENFITACAQKDKEEKMKIYADSRSKVKMLLDQEKTEKVQEISELDTILSPNS